MSIASNPDQGGLASPPTIYVVDDDQKVGAEMVRIFATVSLDVMWFPDASAFLKAARHDSHGCVLLDLRMPGMSGLELQKTLKSRGILLPIIFHTAYGEIETVVQAMKAGAFDFLIKPASDQVLLDSTWRAIQTNRSRLRNMRYLQAIDSRMRQLSSREHDVLEKIFAGCATKQIAAELNLSTKTVENHRARIMSKMQAQNVIDLVRTVCESRLLRLDGPLLSGPDGE